MVWRGPGRLKSHENAKHLGFHCFSGFAVNFSKFHMISWIFLKSMVWGDTGPLQTINIPIGILMFSASGRQDPPETTKNWILLYFLKKYEKLA